MTVTTELTATGGYRYTVVIQLAETAGVSATITAISLLPTDAWGPYPPVATFGPEAWNGSNIIPANGTLTSKPLVATVEFIWDWYRPLEAEIVISDATSTGNREFGLSDTTQRKPEPPPGLTLKMMGTFVDATQQALRDVTVEVLSGANAGRNTRTNDNGAFSLEGLKPGSFSVRFSKEGYRSISTSVDLMANLASSWRLEKE